MSNNSDHTKLLPWDGLREALLSAACLAPMGLLAGQGILLVLGGVYVLAYGIVMLPGATIGVIFLMDTARAAIGKQMSWTPFVLEAIARSNTEVLKDRARSPQIAGNAVLQCTVFGSVMIMAISKRARVTYLLAHKQAFLQRGNDQLPSRAAGYVADHCIQLVITRKGNSPDVTTAEMMAAAGSGHGR